VKNFRPVFAPLLIHTSRDERMKASALRRILAEADYDYKTLQDIWNKEQLEGLKSELSSLNPKATEEQINELVDILDCHFNPEKQSKGVKPRPVRTNKVCFRQIILCNMITFFFNFQNGVQNKNVNSANQEIDNLDSGTTSPDTASSGSPVKGIFEK
jgi:hypothetical protein